MSQGFRINFQAEFLSGCTFESPLVASSEENECLFLDEVQVVRGGDQGQGEEL